MGITKQQIIDALMAGATVYDVQNQFKTKWCQVHQMVELTPLVQTNSYYGWPAVGLPLTSSYKNVHELFQYHNPMHDDYQVRIDYSEHNANLIDNFLKE